MPKKQEFTARQYEPEKILKMSYYGPGGKLKEYQVKVHGVKEADWYTADELKQAGYGNLITAFNKANKAKKSAAKSPSRARSRSPKKASPKASPAKKAPPSAPPRRSRRTPTPSRRALEAVEATREDEQAGRSSGNNKASSSPAPAPAEGGAGSEEAHGDGSAAQWALFPILGYLYALKQWPAWAQAPGQGLWAMVFLKVLPVAFLRHAARGAGTRYAQLVSVGLMLSMLGDVLLEVDVEQGGNNFLFGIGAFFMAHIWYILAFFAEPCVEPSFLLNLMTAIPAYGFGAYIVVLCRPKLPEDLFIPVTFYAAALSTMLQRAFNRCVSPPPGASPQSCLAAFAGAALFAVSDGIIALNRFHAPIPNAKVLIMLTYWAAQFGIALSAYGSARTTKLRQD